MSNVHAVAFSPDGKTLASSGFGGKVTLWDRDTQREIRSFSIAGEKQSVNAPAFAPYGRALASGAAAGTVRIWDLSRIR
jgi:WD40 repeat protein